jgi:hypothetical protein
MEPECTKEQTVIDRIDAKIARCEAKIADSKDSLNFYESLITMLKELRDGK